MRKPNPDKTTMGVQIPNDLIQRLKVYAMKDECSLAWHIRVAIREYLKRKDAEQKAPLSAEIEEAVQAAVQALIPNAPREDKEEIAESVRERFRSEPASTEATPEINRIENSTLQKKGA